MTAALQAIKGYLHRLAEGWRSPTRPARPVRTILDVLAPPAPQV